jgi:dolichol-phosphate mannosyltransferase
MKLDRSGRHAGESSYSLRRLISLSLAVVIRFSDRPLKISVAFGLVISFLAAVVSLTLFIGRLVGTFTVPGWTSTVLSMWFLSGLILAVLGVHGFYLGRVFAEVKRRPRLLVERTTDLEEPPAMAGASAKRAAAE